MVKPDMGVVLSGWWFFGWVMQRSQKVIFIFTITKGFIQPLGI
ncbi:hypothetical protein BPUTEOSOX_1160 [thiotrophic endosymbiont of Bathymodiolus puteoserpentis (Logatchev)]|nr:hypothetical protein BPUTEOSOX_1160 [thiotrophic endosymbiont of Bathymodiolus puteoserpentis (Logatchev)]